VLGFFVVWQLAVVFFEIPVFLLPAPSVILVDSLANFGTLVGHTLVTLKTVLLGFAASVLISLPLAIAITSSAKIAAVIYPILVMTQAIPKVALAPILVILLGTNELPRVTPAALVIKGLRAVGDAQGDIVISNADAVKLKGAVENLILLRKGKVAVVLD